MARLSSVEADFNKLIMLGVLKAVPQLYQVVRVPVPEVDGSSSGSGPGAPPALAVPQNSHFPTKRKHSQP